MLTSIVAGIDGSPGSRDAARIASSLAETTGASLRLVGVAHDPRLRVPGRPHPAPGAVEAMRAVVTEVGDACAPGAEVDVLVDHAPARGLQQAAQSARASLLVLGSSGGAAPGRVRVGRTARQTVRSAPCPVLVTARAPTGTPPVLERIVVGLDGSAESRLALRMGRELAGAAGAHLLAVAVVDDRFPASHVPGAVIIDLADWERIVAADREHMRAMLDTAVPAGEGVSRELREGDPTDGLLAAAAEADLLVIGSRRWGRLSRVVLGSTSEDVLALAPCSVLIVPRPGAEPADAGDAASPA